MVKYSDDSLNSTFSALSDPTRRAILARLSEGEAQVTELAEPFGISLPAVSKHLRVLEQATLVKRRVDGRIHRFIVNPEPLRAATSWVDKYQRFWELQLGKLDEYLKQTATKER